jgi:hypothetical protein
MAFRPDPKIIRPKKMKSKKPNWDHEKIQEWYESTDNCCFECGAVIGGYHPERCHHLVPQRSWKNYTIDIVNDVTNLVKLGGRFECNCHGKAESHKAVKVRVATEKKFDEYLVYRV